MCSTLDAKRVLTPPPSAGLVIRLAIEQTEPLTGSACCPETGAAVPFVGWLELLRTVAELIGSESQRATSSQAPHLTVLEPARGDSERS